MTALCLLATLWFCPDERVISAELVAPLPPVRVEMPATRYVVRTTYVSEVEDDRFQTKEDCERLADYFAKEMPDDMDGHFTKVIECVEVR